MRNGLPEERGSVESEWAGEHERRKRTWNEAEKRSRKERRHPSAIDADDLSETPDSRDSGS
jgi:hypothetical protein